MRTTQTMMKGSEKGPSSRAIEAAVTAYLHDPRSSTGPRISAETQAALRKLVKESANETALREALDCAADDPALNLDHVPIASLIEDIWTVGQSTMIAREWVRFTLGSRATRKLEDIGPMVRDLWQSAADFVATKRSTKGAGHSKPIVYDPDVPSELNLAFARFHMAVVAQAAIVAESLGPRRKLSAPIAQTLVDVMEEGFSAFMPWMIFSHTANFSDETRLRLPRPDFEAIFARHFRQTEALAAFVKSSTDKKSKR